MENPKQRKKCSNCGDESHDFNKCSFPIVSMGIIMFNEEKEVLVIQRKNTMAFIDLIRGRFPNFRYMKICEKMKVLLREITVNEKKRLQSDSFEDLWKFLWGVGEHKRKREFGYAKKRFESKRQILDMLLKDIHPVYTEPEFSFPKGRKNSKETYIECSIREFREETGYSKEDFIMIPDIVFNELYVGTNGVNYKHVYYLVKSTTQDPPRVDLSISEEVGLAGFYKKKDLVKLFRPYERSKVTVIDAIYSHLEKQDYYKSI